MPTRSLLTTLALILLTSSPMTAQPYTVTFVIDMRQEIAAKRFDPAKDVVGVRSGVDPLSWDETLRAQDADGDGRYEVKVSFPERPFGGQPVNYKFKVDAQGKGPNDGWEDGKNRQLQLNDTAQTLARRFNEPAPPIRPVLTGILLVYEHSLVKANDLSKLNAAFFTTNGLISVMLLGFVVADRIFGGM